MYYEAGIWGTEGRNSFNIATRGDQEWCTAFIKQRLKVFRVFLHIQDVNGGRLIKKNHMWSSTDKRS